MATTSSAGSAPDGMPVRGLRRINPIEAEVVRRIFEAYAAGRSARRIAHDLNAEGVAGPRGAEWGASTISGNAARGNGMLNNELYVGKDVWNRQRFIKDPDTGRRVPRHNDATERVVKGVPQLRIVPQELWDRVKARQETMRCDTRPDARARPCERRRPRYLLSGLVVCGACGGRYTKISADLFGCAAARNKGAAVCANLRNVRRDRLEAAVLDALRDNLMDPELLREFCAEYVRETNRVRGDENARRDRSRVELTRSSGGYDGSWKQSRTACPPAPSRRSCSRPDRTSSRRTSPLRPRRNSRYCIRTWPRSTGAKWPLWRGRLADETMRDEAFELIRSLLDRIVLVPEGEELWIEIHGELAGILELCQQGKTPGRSRASPEQIKVVAGARNHLCRTFIAWRQPYRREVGHQRQVLPFR